MSGSKRHFQAEAGKETGTGGPNHLRVVGFGALKRAAVLPMHAASPRARPWIAVVVGTVLEAALTAFGSWHDNYPGVAVAAGILVAVLAGAFGGMWSGLVVGAAGWGLHYVYVADEELRALVGLPVWLAAGALAGWLVRSRHQAAQAGRLAADPELARRMGKAARTAALSRYGLERFLADWDRLLDEVAA